MPVTYRFDSNIVIIEMVGEYSLNEIPATILNSLADSHCPANPSILIDLTESLSIYKRSSEDVATMARSLVSLENDSIIVSRWLLHMICNTVSCAWAPFSLKNRE